jgi:hypothetical protein
MIYVNLNVWLKWVKNTEGPPNRIRICKIFRIIEDKRVVRERYKIPIKNPVNPNFIEKY